MKTSVLYDHYGNGLLSRAMLPSDEGYADGTLEHRRARFRAAHSYKYHRLGETRERTGRQPDCVVMGSTRFELRGGYVDRVRVVPEDYVARMDEIDAKIAALNQELRDLKAEAFRRGRTIRKADLIETTEQKGVTS